MARKQQKPLKAKLTSDHPFYGIIEDAYKVFKFDKPVATGVCECCMERDIEADLFNPPIRELPFHYLRDWYFAGQDEGGVPKGTWGHFLPRILEVLAYGEEVSSIGLEVSLNRFDTGNPERWSKDQWDVLDRFQRAFLDRAIHREDAHFDEHDDYLDDTVCTLALGGWPVDQLIDQIMAASDEALASRFARDWGTGRPTVTVNAFWEDREAEVLALYTSKPLFDRMEALALSEGTKPEVVEQALTVAAIIQDNAEWARV